MYKYTIILFLILISTESLCVGRLYPVVEVLQSKDVIPNSSIPPDASTNLVEGNCTDAHPPDVGYTLEMLDTYPFNASATITFSGLSPLKIYCITAYTVDADPHSVAHIGRGGLNYDYVSVELYATDPHYGIKYNITVYLTNQTVTAL